jgi:uncharacterized membrane protein YhiD involved in acid resistance
MFLSDFIVLQSDVNLCSTATCLVLAVLLGGIIGIERGVHK